MAKYRIVVWVGVCAALFSVFHGMPAVSQPQPQPRPGPPQITPVTLPPLDPAARVTVVEVCPGNDSNLTSEQFAFEVATQDVLLPTLGAVQTYAKPQLGPSPGTRAVAEDLANLSDQFGNTGMGGPWDRRMVYIEAIGTNQDRQRHADALTALVPRPDRVVVCPTVLSEARRAKLSKAISDRFRPGVAGDPRFYGTDAFTPTYGRVAVHLRSDATALAAELQSQYGNDIMLTLGNFSWPDPNDPGPGPRLAARCGDVPLNTAARVDWSLPKAITIRSGETFDVAFKARNPTKQWMPFNSLRAVVTPLSSRHVIAVGAQQVAYALSIEFLLPRKWTPLHSYGGTDSCNATTGWALPPGHYRVYLTSVFPDSGSGLVTSPAIPLTVTP